MTAPGAAVQRTLAAVAAGRMVVITDSPDREDEADLIIAADAMSPADCAFMLRHTSGIVCVALPGERTAALELPQMVTENTDRNRTAFTVSVDAREGTTTGVSATDRAHTVNALADGWSSAQDFRRPGHVFPLRAREGGVLARGGHTEAALDLAVLAGRAPAGVLCELMDDDGTMMRGAAVRAFAVRHDLEMLSIEELVEHRVSTETRVEFVAQSRLPTRFGDFVAHVFRSALDGVEHVALVLGAVDGPGQVLTRVHSECLTGDALGSLRCDCGDQLAMAMRQIGRARSGVVIYLRDHEGRGIGLGHKMRAYALQDEGLDTVDANLELDLPVDARQYSIAAQMLEAVGAHRLRLVTNDPAKCAALAAHGLDVVERVSLLATPRLENLEYLRTKQLRLGHVLRLADDAGGSRTVVGALAGEACWP